MSKLVSHAIRVLVTEAASPTGYHLLPMLASGDIIPGQKVELILCDGLHVQDDLYGVAMEIQDCAFHWLSAVSTTADFCGASKTVDVIIILPPAERDMSCHGNKEVNMSHSALSQIDFKSLDSVVNPTTVSSMETDTVHCRGPLSTAVAIANHIRKLHEVALQDVQNEQRLRHEEAEFGCPPDLSLEHVLQTGMVNPFRTLSIESKTQIVVVTSRDIERYDVDESEVQFERVLARL